MRQETEAQLRLAAALSRTRDKRHQPRKLHYKEQARDECSHDFQEKERRPRQTLRRRRQAHERETAHNTARPRITQQLRPPTMKKPSLRCWRLALKPLASARKNRPAASG